MIRFLILTFILVSFAGSAVLAQNIFLSPTKKDEKETRDEPAAPSIFLKPKTDQKVPLYFNPYGQEEPKRNSLYEQYGDLEGFNIDKLRVTGPEPENVQELLKIAALKRAGQMNSTREKKLKKRKWLQGAQKKMDAWIQKKQAEKSVVVKKFLNSVTMDETGMPPQTETKTQSRPQPKKVTIPYSSGTKTKKPVKVFQNYR